MRHFGWALILIAIGAIWFVGRQGLTNRGTTSTGSANRQAEQGQYQVTQSSPSWWQLAAIESGTMRPPASLAQAFETILISLQRKCANDSGAIHSKEELADIIVHTRDVLRKRGKEFDVLTIAEALDASIPEGAKVGNCKDVAIAFIALQ